MIALGLIAHLLGDYVFQSHWMATQKTRQDENRVRPSRWRRVLWGWWPAVAHGLTYTAAFLLLCTRSVPALAVICLTHIVLDRYRLARHLIWLKNQLAPAGGRPRWREARHNNGFAADVPAGMSTAQLIVADNAVHILINSLALTHLT